MCVALTALAQVVSICHPLDVLSLEEGIIAHEAAVVTTKPDDAVSLFQLSDSHFTKALLACPDSSIVMNFRGILLRRMGRVEEAQASYASALVFSPEFPEVASHTCVWCDVLLTRGNPCRRGQTLPPSVVMTLAPPCSNGRSSLTRT